MEGLIVKWYPSVQQDFFFVGDQAWYLFANKKTLTTSEWTWLSFALTYYPRTILRLMSGGENISQDNVKIIGSTIYVRSSVVVGSDISIVYTYDTVSGSPAQVIQVAASGSLSASGSVAYLDLPIAQEAPIIFDDLDAEPGSLHVEFDVDYDTGLIEFHSSTPSGIFEYGQSSGYAEIDFDLNPENTGVGTGLLAIAPIPSIDVDGDLI